jgi:hypothetical protein
MNYSDIDLTRVAYCTDHRIRQFIEAAVNALRPMEDCLSVAEFWIVRRAWILEPLVGPRELFVVLQNMIQAQQRRRQNDCTRPRRQITDFGHLRCNA